MTPAEKYQYARDFDRWLTRKERKAVGIVRAWIVAIRKRVLQLLESLGSERLLMALTDAVPETSVRTLLNELYRNTLVDAAARMFNQIISRLRNPSPLFQAGFFSQRWQQEQIRIMLTPETSARITQITESTRTQIRKVLVQATSERLTVQQTAKLISQELGGVSARKRALLIARTETTRAASVGAESAATSTGIASLKKIWIATTDSRTRDAHRAMLRKPAIAKDETFVVGGRRMRYPGDPLGGPENCCNCRCAIVYIPA